MSTDAVATPVLNRDLSNLMRALNALDGTPEVVKTKAGGPDGEEASQVILKPYKFGGKTRLALAKWLSAVKSANENLSKAHDGLVKEMASPAAPERVAEENSGKFADAWTAVLAEAASFPLPKVSVDALDPDGNSLPISVLAALDPILA